MFQDSDQWSLFKIKAEQNQKAKTVLGYIFYQKSPEIGKERFELVKLALIMIKPRKENAGFNQNQTFSTAQN